MAKAPNYLNPDLPPGLRIVDMPVVDATAAVKHAKDRLYGLRGGAVARSEADDIQQRHGSRKSGLPPSGRNASRPRRQPAPTSTPQLDLFGDAE